MAAKYLSDQFNLNMKASDDWFDPILGSDTRLFVDPFLIFKDTDSQWVGAHDELIAYFNIIFHMISHTLLTPAAPERVKALDMLRFPEPRAFCLGYTDQGTGGLGGGKAYAKLICEAMELSIGRGLIGLPHFEALGVLNEGIGPDRISDLTCNVLIERFLSYTEAVVKRHKIPTDSHMLQRGEFDAKNLRWNPVTKALPTNPDNGLPVLLVPKRFLRALPQLEAGDFWGSPEASQLRADLNWTISQRVSKKEIVQLARSDPEAVANWTRSREAASVLPYDFERDPIGVYNWLRHAKSYVASAGLNLASPKTLQEFIDVLDKLIQDFKHFVEERGGWKLLSNDDGSEKDEEAAQLLFRGVIEARCEANGIVVDREVNLGRGPVDFKFSAGYSKRALLEVKKLHNGKFWNGLEQQLTSYLKSDKCDVGRYLAVQYRSHKPKTEVGQRRTNLAKVTADLGSRLGLNLASAVVDARKPLSASKL